MSEQSFKRIPFGAAKFYHQSDILDPATKLLMGYTRGGTFKVERTIDQIEVDGLKTPTVGQNVKRDAKASVEVSALQLDSQLYPVMYAGSSAVAGVDGDAGKMILTEVTQLLCTDHIARVIIEANYKDGSLLEIEIDNVLGIGDTEFAYEDKSEVVFTGELVAHAADASAAAQLTLPYRIKIGGEPADLDAVAEC